MYTKQGPKNCYDKRKLEILMKVLKFSLHQDIMIDKLNNLDLKISVCIVINFSVKRDKKYKNK